MSGCMRIADILPLTPLQQGLLFHASTARGSDNDVYAVQLDIALSGALDQHRLRDAVHAVVTRHPHLVARFSEKFDQPVQIIAADPVAARRYLDLISGGDPDLDREQVERVCAAERAAVRRSNRPASLSGGADPHRRRPAPVCADQSPHRARWLVDADPAAGNLRQLSRAAAARGGSVSPVCRLAGRSGPRCRPSGLASGARRF